MPNVIEALRSAGQRISKEGLAFDTAATYASTICYPVQTDLIPIIHEATKVIDPSVSKFLVIAGLGIINAISVAAETKALKSANYSADFLTNTFNIMTKKALLSSLGSHLLGYARMALTNPVNALAIVNTFATGDSQVLQESEIAGAFVFTGWSIITNSIILTSRTGPFVERVETLKGDISKKIKQNPASHEVFRRLGRKN